MAKKNKRPDSKSENTQSGGKKSDVKPGYQPKFFVITSHNNWRDTLQTLLNQISEKYKVRQLNILNIELADIQYSNSFNNRDWSWNEKFFSKYLISAETVNYEQAWWRDQCINQVGIMLWNLVNKTVKTTWKETGTYPGAENLSRKIRNSDEGAAEHFADKELVEFEDNFK